MLTENSVRPQRKHAKPRQGRLFRGGGPVREPMSGQHARMLAEQDGRGARSAQVHKQHTKNQRRKCLAWKQHTRSTRRPAVFCEHDRPEKHSRDCPGQGHSAGHQ